jgi:hypothetical protein
MTTESSLEYEVEHLRDRRSSKRTPRHNEASAIGYAKREAAKAAREEIAKNLRALGANDDFIEKALKGGT